MGWEEITIWTSKFKLLYKCPCIPFKKKKRTESLEQCSVGTGRTDSTPAGGPDLQAAASTYTDCCMLEQSVLGIYESIF